MFRFERWILAAVAITILIAVGFSLRQHTTSDPRSLLSALPSAGTTLVFADVVALRGNGLMDLLAGPQTTGSPSIEEPDYQRFVTETGFNYRADLDAVAAVFLGPRTYLTVRGRFRWKQLEAYATSQGGECHSGICSLAGSTAERNISFSMMKPDVLALAVAPEREAVTAIRWNGAQSTTVLPKEPIWLSVPAASLFQSSSPVKQMMMGELKRVLSGTETLLIAAGPDGNQAVLRLEIVCDSANSAAKLAQSLARTAIALRPVVSSVVQEPGDLAGLFAAGIFEQHAAVVTARWPLPNKLLRALAAGSTP